MSAKHIDFNNKKLHSSFYQVVRRLHNTKSLSDDLSKIKFNCNYSISFSGKEIEKIHKSSEKNTFTITTNILGLVGAGGVLPIHETQRILFLQKNKEYALLDFYNIFQNRLLENYYKGWERYSFLVDYEKTKLNKNYKSEILNSLNRSLGFNAQDFNFRLQHYRYFLSPERSPAKLQQLLQDHTGLNVKVKCLQPFTERLPLEHLSVISNDVILGKHNLLGKTLVLGDKLRMDHMYFEIHLFFDDYYQYCDFVANPSRIQDLRQIVEAFTGIVYKFCFKVFLESDKKQAWQLCSQNKLDIKLGVNSFLLSPNKHNSYSYGCFSRFCA